MKEPEYRDDDASPISRVDRYILVVTPQNPFVEWVQGLEEKRGSGDGEGRYSLQEAQTPGVTTYLVPFSFDPALVIAWVTDNCEVIFESELHGMESDPQLWPSERTSEIFEEWFDLQLLDAPIDLVDGPVYLNDLSAAEQEERIRELGHDSGAGASA